jgi:transglutaminase-like putative cysteine protease
MNLHAIESISYTLKPTTDQKLVLPVSASQAVEPSETEIIVTVTDLTPAENVPFPYQGDNPDAIEALKATDYLQCDNEKIIEMAKQAVQEAPDTAAAAKQIEAFVDGYIIQKDLSVGYASAAEVAQTRQGDCSEHAVLATAMCRAAGIPARIVCGVVYADSFLSKQSIFGGHMWTEVYIGDTWIGLDATRSEQQGFGPGHIALAQGNGEPTDFFGLVNTLGCFKIESIVLTEKKEETKAVATE